MIISWTHLAGRIKTISSIRQTVPTLIPVRFKAFGKFEQSGFTETPWRDETKVVFLSRGGGADT